MSVVDDFAAINHRLKELQSEQPEKTEGFAPAPIGVGESREYHRGPVGPAGIAGPRGPVGPS